MTDVAAPPTLTAEEVHSKMRQLRYARQRIAEEIATCDADRAKLRDELILIDEHQERVTKDDREWAAMLERELTAHLLNLRATDDRIKSVKTPWGDITSTAQQPDFDHDDAVLLAWARGVAGAYPGLVRYFEPPAPVPDWAAIKRLCHVDDAGRFLSPEGLPVPGVTVRPKPLKVSVEVVP